MFYHFIGENARKPILATAVSFLGTEEEMRERKKKAKRISAYDSTYRSSYEERAQRRKSVRKAFSVPCVVSLSWRHRFLLSCSLKVQL